MAAFGDGLSEGNQHEVCAAQGFDQATGFRHVSSFSHPNPGGFLCSMPMSYFIALPSAGLYDVKVARTRA